MSAGRTELAVVFEDLVGPRLQQVEALMLDLGARTARAWADCSFALKAKQRILVVELEFEPRHFSNAARDEVVFLARACGGAAVKLSELSTLERANFLAQAGAGRQLARAKAPAALPEALDKLLKASGVTRTWAREPFRLPLLLSHQGVARYDARTRRISVRSDAVPPVGMKLPVEVRLPQVPTPLRFEAAVTAVRHGRRASYGLSVDGLDAEARAVLGGFASLAGAARETPSPSPSPSAAGEVLRVAYQTEDALAADRPFISSGSLFVRGAQQKVGTAVQTEVVMPDGRVVQGRGTVVGVEASGASIQVSLDSLFALSGAIDLSPPPFSSQSVMATVNELTARPPEDLVPVARVGHYELLSRLGRGGMADVYYARPLAQSGLTGMVAIKRLAPEFARDSGCFELFALEADVTRQLRHPHLVHTLDVGLHDGQYFLVMELVDGRNLAQLIHKCLERDLRLPVDCAVMIARCVLDGLAYTHEARGPRGDALEIVHCDVSPPNVFASKDGEVKLGDFGVASVRGSGARVGGRVAAKVHYLSPEGFGGDLSRARDLWAAAVTLYELIALRRPWEAEPEALREALRSPPPPLSALRPEVRPELQRVVERALAFRPEERFPSAAAFRDALDGCFDAQVGTPLALAAILRALFVADGN